MGLACIPFILLELFMSLNACLDIKWAYIVFLSYFWNYLCFFMHAQILNAFSLYSFHTFGIIHASYPCLDIKWAYIVLLSYFWNYSCPLNACSDIKWVYIVLLSYFWNYSCLLDACLDIKWA